MAVDVRSKIAKTSHFEVFVFLKLYKRIYDMIGAVSAHFLTVLRKSLRLLYPCAQCPGSTF